MADKLQPIETPFDQKVADFKRRYLPLIVWSVAAVACLWMLGGRAGRFELIGLARSVQYEVSASTVGQIDSLLVDLYDEVQAGDLVAKLDDDEIAARIERSRATIRQLAAELEAARATGLASKQLDQAGWTDDLRRFKTDEEDRRLAVLELRVGIESDEIERERLALELQRADPLLEAGLIGEQQHDNIRLQYDALAKMVDESRILLAQTESELRTAQLRREQFEQSLPELPDEEPVLSPLREAIEAETHRLAEIQARRRATELRSPITGQVSSILCRNGQTVVPGEPILTIADGQVTEILAYLSERDGEMAQANTPVLVASLNRPESVAESIVVRSGPDIELLPERLWRDSQTPEYGRAVIIAAVPGLELTPGELLSVKLLD